MRSPWLPAAVAAIMLERSRNFNFDFYNSHVADELRRPYVGKRRTSGTDRDKVKAARKQNRRRRK